MIRVPVRLQMAAWCLCVCLVIGSTIGTALLFERQPVISDSIGYLYAAQSIASGHGPVYEDANNALAGQYFSLYAFQIRRANTDALYLGFPPGLSMLLALPLLLNPDWVLGVIPGTVLLCLVCVGIIAWLLTKSVWGTLWALLIIGVTPGLWYFGTAFWSELPSAALVTAALALYVNSHISTLHKRTETICIALAGALLAYGVFIRYTNLVVLFVFLAADALVLFRQRNKLSSHWPLWVISGAVMVLVLLFNQIYYGDWTRTSYSAAHGWYPYPAFSLHYAFSSSFIDGYSLRRGMETLWHNFGVFLPFALLGWLRSGRSGGILAGISLSVFALHAVYAFAPVGVNARFLLLTFPMIAIGASVGIVVVLRKLTLIPRLVLSLALVAVAVWTLPTTLQASIDRNLAGTHQIALIESIAAATPSDAVLMSYPLNDLFAVYGNRSVFNYRRVLVSDPIQQRYLVDEAVPTIISTITTLLEHERPVYFVENQNDFIRNLPEILASHFQLETIVISDTTLYKLQLPAGHESTQ